jgi:branched-chain amino acid aminotransferase
MIQSEFAWMNGKLIPFAQATTHISAFSLHYGVAAFEGIRCYQRHDGRSAVFRLREHIDRLFGSMKVCGSEVPFTVAQVEAACLEVLRANQLREAYLRPLIFAGPGALGLGSKDAPIETVVIAFPWGAYLGEEALQKGIRAHVSSFVRGHVNNLMSKAKICGQYVNSVLAKREAQRHGYDEAIMLDSDGRVAEGTGENIFAIHKGRIHTPPLDMPILEGTRLRGGRAVLHARLPLSGLRGVLHGHRLGGHAGARDRQSRHRHRPARAGHAQAAGGVRSGGQGAGRAAARMAGLRVT